MSRPRVRVSCRVAAAAFWLTMMAACLGAGARQVSINISGLLFEDKLNQSANSLPEQIEPAPGYTYSINATVHGTGLFADVFGDGTPLATVLNFIQAGSSSKLAGTVPNLSGTLPIDLLNQPYAGSVTFLGVSSSTSADLDLAVDAYGTATVSISNVNISVNGKPTTADALVVEPGSTVTVTAVEPPIATTGTANGITQTGAVLNGAVNPEAAPTTVTFLWGTSGTYGNTVTAQEVAGGLGAVAVSATLSGLTPGDVYHYAIQVANITGTNTSADSTFETTPPPPPGSPTVSTGGASPITYTSATLSAAVDPNGSDTTVTFQYGPDANYGSTSAAIDAGSGNAETEVSGGITGLSAGQTYHYRAVASNTDATIYGLDQVFQTPPGAAAAVFTTGASGVGLNAASVSALVNPMGTDTSVTFEYGTTTAYGFTLSPGQDIGAGSTNVAVTGTLTGLSPGTLYHYRADATNSDGLVTGADQVFATTSIGFGSYLGKYAGLVVASPVAFASSGLFTVSITQTGAYSASGKLGGKTIRFAGKFSEDGSSIVDIPKTGITVHMQVGGSGATRNITGSLSGALNAVFNAALAQTATLPALYTVRMPHPANPNLPQGNGYGSLKVSANGTVKLTGKLCDGTAVTYSTPLLNNGAFPIYLPLYGNAGSIAGDAVFETTANGVLDAGLEWFKPGFNTPLELYGSAYSPPKGASVVAVSAGVFEITPANSASFFEDVTLSTSNHLTPAKPNLQAVSASITPATGLFSGAALNPATHKLTHFSGAFFQDTNTGTGVFLGPQTGEVDFGAQAP